MISLSHYFLAPAFLFWLFSALCFVLILLNCSELNSKWKRKHWTISQDSVLHLSQGKSQKIFLGLRFLRKAESSPPRSSLSLGCEPMSALAALNHNIFICLTVSAQNARCGGLVLSISVCPASVTELAAGQLLTKCGWMKIRLELELWYLGFSEALCKGYLNNAYVFILCIQKTAVKACGLLITWSEKRSEYLTQSILEKRSHAKTVESKVRLPWFKLAPQLACGMTLNKSF